MRALPLYSPALPLMVPRVLGSPSGWASWHISPEVRRCGFLGSQQEAEGMLAPMG